MAKTALSLNPKLAKTFLFFCFLTVLFIASNKFIFAKDPDDSATNKQNQELRIVSKVERTEVEVGNPFTLVITVEGDLSGASLERVEFPPQLQVMAQSQSTSISLQLGRMKRALNLEYLLVAREAGQVKLGPFKITKSGNSYATEPIELSVKKPLLPPGLEPQDRYTL